MEKILEENKLAIIVPVLGCLDYTKQMIATIKTKHPYRLILINNNSPDGTKEYFDKLADGKNVSAIHFSKNMGVSRSWNFGIRFAMANFGSEYFFIPNNDIILHPLAIDLLVFCLRFPDVLLATATDVSARVNEAKEVLTFPLPSSSVWTEEPDFSCFMIKKKTIDIVGFFDDNFYPAYFEDNDYHYRIRLKSFNAIKDNRALYFHYGSRTIREDEEVKRLADAGYLKNREYYREKWGGYPGEEIYKTPFNK